MKEVLRPRDPAKCVIRKIMGGHYYCQHKDHPHTGYGTSLRNAWVSWANMVWGKLPDNQRGLSL